MSAPRPMARALTSTVAPFSRRAPKWRLDALATPLTLVLVTALFALCHPYDGIIGDSSVYIGRILADHDSAGLGRDLLFANDGQSSFSLFRHLAGPLVVALGPSRAAEAIAGLGDLCWLAGLIALAHGLAKGRVAWAIVILVTVLPIGYGDTGHFSFAETTAVPRPFAEAAVMGAFAALLAGRARLAVAGLAVAFALHPIMALPGVGVAAIVWLWQLSPARRLAALASISALAGSALLLAVLGVPLFDRITSTVDADWIGMIMHRGPHLFPSLWAPSALSPLAAQVATIAVAARLAPVRQRRFLVAVMLVGVAGLIAALLLSDTLHLLLFVQLQTWRATWLLGVLGGCALAVCAAGLWYRDNDGRLVLALLALAWFFPAGPLLTCAVCGLALALEFGTRRSRTPSSDRIVAFAYGLVGLAIAYWWLGGLLGYVGFLRALPAGDTPRLTDPIRNDLHTLPLVLFAGLWLLGPRLSRPWANATLAASATFLTIAAAGLWDQRTVAAQTLETLRPPPGFAAMMAGRPDEVLWVDGMAEAWFTLRRRQYLSAQQAVSIVFSRPLAMQWRRRARGLVAYGLARRSLMTPFATPADDDRLDVTQAGIDAFCRRADAPGAIILPLAADAPPPSLSGMLLWHPAGPLFAYERHASAAGWQSIAAFAAVPCHPAAP